MRHKERCQEMGMACIEKWALEDILKIHTTASKAFELTRFAASSTSLAFLRAKRAIESTSATRSSRSSFMVRYLRR